MAQFPALPLWTDAYLADCGHLSYEESGIYLAVLMQMWRAPECRLPNDDGWLARRFRMTLDEVAAKLRPILKEFCQTDGNWLFQKRLAREFEFISSSRSKQSARAKSMWQKKKGSSRGNATHTHNTDSSFTTPLSESESSKSNLVLVGSNNAKILSLVPPDDPMPWPIFEPTGRELALWAKSFPCFNGSLTSEVRSIQNAIVEQGREPETRKQQHAMVERWLDIRAKKKAESGLAKPRPEFGPGYRRY